MRTFIALSRTRNFRRTAEQLHTTQPAISARLSSLEAEYGCQLVDRSAGTFRLTPEGEIVLLAFEQALETLDAAAAQLSGEKAPHAEPLRLGAIDSVAATWMPDLIERLHVAFPALQIELTVDGTAPLVAGLKEGRLDMIFAIQPAVDEGFRSFSPCVMQMVWVGSPRLIDPERRYAPRDLAQMPIITFPNNSPPFKMIAPYFYDENVLASKLTSCNSLFAIVSLLVDGFGVAVLPAVALRDELKRGRLYIMKTTKRFPAMPIVASYNAVVHRDVLRVAVDTARATAAEFCARIEPGMAWVE